MHHGPYIESAQGLLPHAEKERKQTCPFDQQQCHQQQHRLLHLLEGVGHVNKQLQTAHNFVATAVCLFQVRWVAPCCLGQLST